MMRAGGFTMRRYIALFLFLASPSHAQDVARGEVYRITEQGGGLGVFIDQTVTVSRTGDHWAAERTREESNWCGARVGTGQGSCRAANTKTHDRIDGSKCPQLADALRSLSAIPLPRFAAPDGFELWTVSDTSLLTVEGWAARSTPAASGPWQTHLSISEYTGPFRAWWSATEKALTPCWVPVWP